MFKEYKCKCHVMHNKMDLSYFTDRKLTKSLSFINIPFIFKSKNGNVKTNHIYIALIDTENVN